MGIGHGAWGMGHRQEWNDPAYLTKLENRYIAAANQTAYLLFASAKILAGETSYQTAAANVQDRSWRYKI